MLSRFFSKSQPIHYLIVGLIVLVVLTATKFVNINEPLSLGLVLRQLLLIGLCMFSIFMFDFLTSKNKLTKKNSYDILVFTLFIALIPQTVLNTNILIAHLFILFGLRRIISLRSKKFMKKKLLDASIWISIATLFYFWASLYFSLIFLGLIFYKIADIKNWIIPVVGLACVIIISLAYMITANIDYLQFYEGLFDYSFDFSSLNDIRLIIGITILLSYGNWALFFYINKLKSKMKSYRPAFIIVVFSQIVALLIIVFAPVKNGSEFLFLFAPMAIIMTNYLENLQEEWFKELLLWLLIVTPVVTMFINV